MAQKNSKQLERHIKGISNHWRIDILRLIAKEPDITVENIAERLRGNHKTISAHTLTLLRAGLIEKRYLGHMVLHKLSPYGKRFYDFLASF